MTGLKKDLKTLREENKLLREKITALEETLAAHGKAEATEDLQAANEELQSRINRHLSELARSHKLLQKEMSGRKLMEKHLSDSEEKYRGLFNISPEGIMLFDTKGNVITGNDRICQLYGYPYEEMLKLSLKDIVPAQLEGNFPRLVENLRNKGNLIFTSQAKRRDGSVFPVELSAGLFLWKGEVSVQVLVRDITQRKQIEEALEASENRLRSIIENSVDGILIIDKNGIVRFVNPASERLFDRPADEFIGEPFAIPLTGGETAEIVIEQTGRRPLTVEIRVSEISWEGMTAYLASLRDVTARKDLEEFKDDFINTVSHEMRNPLAVLRVGIGQIGDGIPGPINKDQHEILSITLKEIDRLSRLVNNLLDLSNIEAGRVAFQRSLFDFNLLISDATEKFRRTAEEKKLQLAVDLPSAPLLLYADLDRLHQVLTNLVENAFKFTPPGGEIVISAAPAPARGIECSVTDTGIGLDDPDIERVFGKFTRCSYLNEGDVQGSGLGLAISRELIELHGGRIWVENQPDRGCRFAFRIPDHRSEKSLAAYLVSLQNRADEPRSRVGLLGFCLENLTELRQEWGREVISSFSREFFQRLGLMIQKFARAMPHCWLIDDFPGFVVVLRGAGPDEIRKIHEKTLRKLKTFRFQHEGRALEFGLRSAWIAPGDREAAGPGLIDALKARLEREEARVPRARSRGRVLVVDDEPTVVKLLTNFLSREDIETESAFNGEQAIQAAGRGPLDLIILDMGLPKISGYEVINHLRKNHQTFDIPLILMSGHEIDQVRVEKSGAGATPILLEKPFDYQQVREAVNQKLAIEDIPV